MASATSLREFAARPVSGVLQQDALVTKPTSRTSAAESSVRYTCFIRLPFPRADFVDPPQVEWSSAKDRSLWKIISKASNSKDLDWEDLSSRFEVSLSFLLQQAAWLYERHFTQMKAQMKKLSPSANPSPIPPDSIPPDSTSNISTPITGTFATGSLALRTTSAMSARARDSPTPGAGSGNSGTLKQNNSSPVPNADTSTNYGSTVPTRTLSTHAATHSRGVDLPSPLTANTRSFRSSFGNQRKAVPQAQPEGIVEYDSSPRAELSESESDSDSSEDGRESQSMARSQAFRRPHHRGERKAAGLGLHGGDPLEDDEDDESSGGFLPFAPAATADNDDPAATLRSPPPKRTTERASQPRVPVDSSTSSASSVTASSHQQRRGKQTETASALSPRHRAELTGPSSHLRREGSDGTPSMGSSFSDLDDASISQSALEDAYLSNMQRGAASRMSTISQALKSRYL